jgi:hypothetical protein
VPPQGWEPQGGPPSKLSLGLQSVPQWKDKTLPKVLADNSYYV